MLQSRPPAHVPFRTPSFGVASPLHTGHGSVVLKPVPHNTTVAGVPAQVVGTAGCAEPSRAMDQMLYDLGP